MKEEELAEQVRFSVNAEYFRDKFSISDEYRWFARTFEFLGNSRKTDFVFDSRLVQNIKEILNWVLLVNEIT